MHARFSKLMCRDSGFTQTEHNLIHVLVIAHGDDQQTGIRRSNILVPYLSRTDSEELDQTAPEENLHKSIMDYQLYFFRYRWAFNELQSSPSRACKMCPILAPQLKYLGGLLIFIFKRYLKAATDEDDLTSFGREFHARMVEGRKEL